MALDAEIRAALMAGLSPERLDVVNESALHAGHSGDDGSGESHWRVVIAASSLEGQSRIAKHRAVHAALGPAIIGRIHALAISFD
ncbi:BolA protein [Loktanella sp. DSM 29012]|uniref:BolA family transcriptional regulator n=1 Tax=Loktanella gaetbuli TaxID=2881335 RepID=A0ABS8BPX0_9RHOB|nr:MULTISPECIES: BolA family protein [Loktanella]MCB5197654.1 BolA family transcriptional regulator [Loktanella gaetbuli]SEP94790.1 BolA protein [Loktanella sp. DSM 29012]